MVRLFHLLKKGNQVLSIGKELLSCFSHAKKRDFHENPDHIYTELTLYTQQKKLRKLCLRGYDKRSKTFKDF